MRISDWSSDVCSSDLFPYLQTTYGLTTVETGFFTAVPLAAGAAGNWLGGVGSDFAVRRTGSAASLRYVAIIGFVLAAIGLVGCLNSETAKIGRASCRERGCQSV